MPRLPWSARRLSSVSLALFLILVTPFAVFMKHQQYGFAHLEIALFVLLLAALALLAGAVATLAPALEVVAIAGLLTLLIDIQFLELGLKKLGLIFFGLCGTAWLLREHAARIVSLMMATVLVLSLLPSRPQAVAAAPAPAPDPDLPLVVHLVLDEHIGVEGLPPEFTTPAFKQQFQSFFLDRGFRLFGRAYSEYPITLWSIPQLLNLSPGQYVPGFMMPGPNEGTYRLTRNAYFERLADRGYVIRVHQSDYLDVCTEAVRPSDCRTHPVRSLRVLEGVAMPVGEKLAIVAGSYVARSEAYTRAKAKYWSVRRRFVEAGVPLPQWNWERGAPSPITTMPMFDAVAGELSRAQRGTFVYAHLLLPHYPYVFDDECRQRPRTEWLSRNDADNVDVPGGMTNLESGRETRYRLYLEQITCTQRQIDRLLDTIPSAVREDAILIVNGDHGSRISRVDPTIVNDVSPTPADFADHFSTLFAVRSPGIAPRYDLRVAPITCLLRTLVESDLTSVSSTDACSAPHTVFFFGDDLPQPRPLPAFPSARRE
jgi:hypothetical protein